MSASWSPTALRPLLTDRRRLGVVLAAAGVFSLALLALGSRHSSYSVPHVEIEEPGFDLPLAVPSATFDRQHGLANLLPDERYITSVSYLGFTNQFQSILNLLYLAHLTSRIAIIPALAPSHMKHAQFRRFSDVFDLDRFRRTTGIAVIEWEDIKSAETGRREQLGCWASLEASFEQQGVYPGRGQWEWPPKIESAEDHGGLYSRHHKFDIVRWPLPLHVRATESNYIPFEAITAFDLDFVLQRDWLLAANDSTRQTPDETSVRPNTQLFCLDDTFYMKSASSARQPTRFAKPALTNGPREIYGLLGYGIADPPAWTTVGQHLHFSRAVSAATDAILAELGARQPYIGVHMRAGDTFHNAVTSIDEWDEKIAEVKVMLKETRWADRLDRLGIVVASDNPSTELKSIFKQRRWTFVDHDVFDTVRRYDPWYPALIDACVLSRSVGFVGTHRSTYSIYAWLRTESWQHGAGIEMPERNG